MTGPDLYQFVKTNKLNKSLLAKASNISVRTLGDRYHDEIIKDHYLIRLRKGVEKLTGIKNFDQQFKKDDQGNSDHKRVVKALELTIVAQGKRITKLENELAECKNQVTDCKKEIENLKKPTLSKGKKSH